MRYRLVRESNQKFLLGVVRFRYKVHAIEDENQRVAYYSHLIEFQFGRTIWAWGFRDNEPRYELPVEK